MFFDSVRCIWTGRIGAAGKDVWLLHQGDQVWRMSAASAFNMVGVDSASFESSCGLLDEAGFVEGVAVQFALNVVLVTDPTLFST